LAQAAGTYGTFKLYSGLGHALNKIRGRPGLEGRVFCGLLGIASSSHEDFVDTNEYFCARSDATSIDRLLLHTAKDVERSAR